MKPTILVVEDDRRIAALVAKHLEAAGFAVRLVHDGESAIEALAKFTPALVVLDIGLPGADGLEVTRRLRRDSTTPVLMLTARSAESDKVLGLELGADDYLTKPFGTAELVARVRALLRRTNAEPQAKSIVAAGLTIDPDRRDAERGGVRIELTTLEFDLLWFLASNAGRVFSREHLLERVWGGDRVVTDRSIDSLVSRLRKKIEIDPESPVHLQTVWGAGYRFSDGAA